MEYAPAWSVATESWHAAYKSHRGWVSACDCGSKESAQQECDRLIAASKKWDESWERAKLRLIPRGFYTEKEDAGT